jgi:hypothetical protein
MVKKGVVYVEACGTGVIGVNIFKLGPRWG